MSEAIFAGDGFPGGDGVEGGLEEAEGEGLAEGQGEDVFELRGRGEVGSRRVEEEMRLVGWVRIEGFGGVAGEEGWSAMV